MSDTSLIVPNQDEQNTNVNPFNTVVFGETTFSDIIQKSLESIDKVEKELYELGDVVKDLMKKSKGTDKENYYMTIYGEQYKGFLEIVSQQNDSRSKIIQAATNVIKATQSQQPIIGNVFANSLSGQLNNLSHELDPLKKVSLRESEIKPMESGVIAQLENDIKRRIEDETDDIIEIIHSPSYNSNPLNDEE